MLHALRKLDERILKRSVFETEDWSTKRIVNCPMTTNRGPCVFINAFGKFCGDHRGKLRIMLDEDIGNLLVIEWNTTWDDDSLVWSSLCSLKRWSVGSEQSVHWLTIALTCALAMSFTFTHTNILVCLRTVGYIPWRKLYSCLDEVLSWFEFST